MDDNPWGKDPSPLATPKEPSVSSPPSPPSSSGGLTPEWETAAAPLDLPPSTSAPSTPPVFSASSTPIAQDVSEVDLNATTPPALPAAPSLPPFEPATNSDSIPLPSSILPPLSEIDQGPPMDNFDDEESNFAEAPSASQPDFNDDEFGAPAEDDFDDFDEANAGNDDFGDFGDFDAAEETAFEASNFTEEPAEFDQNQRPAMPSRSSTGAFAASSSNFPPLRLDLTNPTKSAIAPQLAEFLKGIYPTADETVSDEPERHVDGVAQVLVSEPLRELLSNLSSLPPLGPLDWKRSKIRREHLIALGVPVNLDDSLEVKPMASLVLPNQSSASPASPILRANSPGNRSVSSPIVSSPSNQIPSRASTPFAERERQRAQAQAPPLDRKLADKLLALGEEDLNLMSLPKLKALKSEIDEISSQASGALTFALLAREKENGDAETYNGMIQDLVIAAAKVKTTSARQSTPPARATSGRWGRNSVK